MQQNCRGTVEVDRRRLIQHVHPAACAEILAEQKVAVAVQERQIGTVSGKLAQAVGDVELEAPGGIITDPGFEQITQDVDGLGFARRTGQEAPEPVADVGTLRTQMEVRYEQRLRALLDAWPQRISTDSMTTGSTGKSWCGPRASVGTKRISSTTSIPSVTRPKTA